jgi:hypothetical protein
LTVTSEIESEDRGFARADTAGDAQQGTVAAGDHDQVGAADEFVPGDRVRADTFGDTGFRERRPAFGAKPSGQQFRDSQRLATVTLHDHPDRLY